MKKNQWWQTDTQVNFILYILYHQILNRHFIKYFEWSISGIDFVYRCNSGVTRVRNCSHLSDVSYTCPLSSSSWQQKLFSAATSWWGLLNFGGDKYSSKYSYKEFNPPYKTHIYISFLLDQFTVVWSKWRSHKHRINILCHKCYKYLSNRFITCLQSYSVDIIHGINFSYTTAMMS